MNPIIGRTSFRLFKTPILTPEEQFFSLPHRFFQSLISHPDIRSHSSDSQPGGRRMARDRQQKEEGSCTRHQLARRPRGTHRTHGHQTRCSPWRPHDLPLIQRQQRRPSSEYGQSQCSFLWYHERQRRTGSKCSPRPARWRGGWAEQRAWRCRRDGRRAWASNQQ